MPATDELNVWQSWRSVGRVRKHAKFAAVSGTFEDEAQMSFATQLSFHPSYELQEACSDNT